MKKQVLVGFLSGILVSGLNFGCSSDSEQTHELKASEENANEKSIFGGSGGSEVFTYGLSSGCSHHSPQYSVTTAWKKLTVESQSASFGEKYLLEDWTGKISRFVRNGGYGSPVVESTMEFKDGQTYQDALNEIEKIVSEVKKGNLCTNGVPELQQAVDFVQDHKTVFGKRPQSFSMSSGCSHHSEQYEIKTDENSIEVYAGGYTQRKTLKVSLSGEAKGVISQILWKNAEGTENSLIQFSDKEAAEEALSWMKKITEATLNGNYCGPEQTNLVEVVAKLDEMIQSL